ncbi:MAG: tRNA (adenosine(37)-N6)-threonylcarbamoyltransferase complex dimerization subunit type 1 TsaB [Ruminococcaceae bacterium]|nr:tRNA (adenosine(37)-N6)-threonylcarbamoyltransferase complex dimerization subunit type 1 TsaB [Oscillospiraceae bacterium]
MKILAMDTSSVNATVALSDNNRIMGEYTVSNDRAHSQIIMPMLDELLRHCSVQIKEVDVFAVALGPGSFTGLRIGIAAMKTLAQALNKPIIGISSLDAVAASFFATDKIICPIFDARRNDVYNAVYFGDKKLVADRIVDFDELLIEMSEKDVIFAGDAVLKYADKIKSFDKPNWHIAPGSLLMQRASTLAAIAYDRALNGDYDNLFEVSPIYIRLPQAEREYNLAHGIAIN